MPDHSGFIQVGQERLHYIRMGNGPQLLIAFHGYGNDAAVFTAFGSYLGRQYTVYSIDLPHHGQSKWPVGKQLQITQLEALATTLMQQMSVQKFVLLGYSMGGRVCLTLAEHMPNQVAAMLLIASDGLVFSPLYHFVTRNFAGRQLFKGLLASPEKYFRFINWLRKKNLLDESRYKFALRYLEDYAGRSFLLKVWPSLARIVPNRNKLRKLIRQKNIPVYIFMGKYDRIIPPKFAQSFKKDIDNIQLFVLEKGHRVFDAGTIPQMAACLLQ